MSSFNCEYCGTAIIDTPSGYITECVHYKAECTCFEAYTCVNHRREAIGKLNNLAKDKETSERLKERFRDRKHPVVGRD